MLFKFKVQNDVKSKLISALSSGLYWNMSGPLSYKTISSLYRQMIVALCLLLWGHCVCETPAELDHIAVFLCPLQAKTGTEKPQARRKLSSEIISFKWLLMSITVTAKHLHWSLSAECYYHLRTKRNGNIYLHIFTIVSFQKYVWSFKLSCTKMCYTEKNTVHRETLSTA